MGVNLCFGSVMTWAKTINGYDIPVYVVFSTEQADAALKHAGVSSMLLCVDIPRSQYCADVDAAAKFFGEGN